MTINVTTESRNEASSGGDSNDQDDSGSPSAIPRDPSGSDADEPPSFDLVATRSLLDDRDRSWLEDHLHAVLNTLSAPIARIAVRVVDDADMTTLHERHLGIDEPTDVLTFHHSAPDEPVDADIAVCIDEARRQAHARGHDARVELLLYAVHGLLHCLGYDDHSETEYAAMHAEEDRILKAIGVGVVFDRESFGDDLQ